MAKKDLIVDDDYCNTLAKYFESRGAHIEYVLNEYLTILNDIKEKGIQEGEVSKTLETYISYCKKMQNRINQISSIAHTQTISFVNKIKDIDHFKL